MSYVLVGILLLVIASAFITFLVLTATRRSSPAREEGGPPGIGADDETPLGDTSEHAGEHEGGVTVGEDDHSRAGSGGAPRFGADSVTDDREPASAPPEGRFQRDPVGGEAEGRPFTPEEPRR